MPKMAFYEIGPRKYPTEMPYFVAFLCVVTTPVFMTDAIVNKRDAVKFYHVLNFVIDVLLVFRASNINC